MGTRSPRPAAGGYWVERPALGIPEGLVRVSAGIESVDDLWADLQQALAKAAVVRA